MSEKKVKLSSGGSLQAFLSAVIDEGVKSALHQKALTEKEKQSAMASSGQGGGESSGGGLDDLFGGSDDGGGDEGGSDEDTFSKTMDDETEKLKQGDIKPKDIVEKLNAIRSGRSFKDSSVSSSMEEYINSLSKAEKTALMAFLKGIAQIVTGEIPAQQASDPGDNPADVQMDKQNEPQVFHKKPNVIKGAGGPSGGAGKSVPAEDTSAPAPITPKRR